MLDISKIVPLLAERFFAKKYRKWRVVGLFTTLLLLWLSFFTDGPLSAQVQNYSYTYNLVNVYDSYTLEYQFTGLDSTTEYRFTLELLTDSGGYQPLSTLIVGPGATTGQFAF